MKFCIIGLGYFGKNLALSLARARTEVLAVDILPNKVDAVKDDVSHAVILDSSQPEALAKLPLADMDAVVVAIGENFEASLLTVAHLQELGVKRIIARVINPIHEKLLKLMKVEELILPEAESAQRMAQSLVRGVLNSLDLTGGFIIVEARAPGWLVGRSLQEAGLRSNFKINLVTVRKTSAPQARVFSRKSERELIGVPPADYHFEAEDLLVLFGEESRIHDFLKG
ncbi:MAG TPA: TrkA family potassium uptake protein [Opitutaceae bacterium]